ncbi:MAG: DNA repair protein RecO [Flavobacteriales bacterium CG_4_9_14_0_2_um_filter_35_242]|nr:DNA repair protein RecO [Zetaproteobacteria bacterium]NDK18292.1 DNA repair protein RecO [Flavobacteriales bacterium]OIO12041.1 MAG: DNA repair protein RecO [Flavobacteriaceae bacterium CG1_02_35_72]PIV17124.1 MAG: DNA repair protein RecO [Flavobacteriales bacterium CG03_land_8_20_14_0_80_35_15]PIX07340.1 MAG: DNA repair protein RecO [Flavobacteriales bacterium CG_4_8_14_3_um_filter_35_10]PJA04974.1 MAG: DNA repair protein RecO [Flavobacteriales bacterium CG_4_10_14_0_2_um_filter_35_18]PJC
MIVKVKALVLRCIKFQDTSLIIKCYTEQGLKSYLLKGILGSKKSPLKIGYFQPLNLLELVANHNDKGTLNSIREVKIAYSYRGISSDVVKQSIVLFLADVLNTSLQEEEVNKNLFKFLETSFQYLDNHSEIANFHLVFLLKLTKYLGFYPQIKNSDYPYFNLQEGLFENQSLFNSIQGEKKDLFKNLLETNFENMQMLKLDKTQRQLLLSILINYYELHVSGFKKLNSLPILQAVFN